MDDFVLKYPGGHGRGILKHKIHRGPRGGGFSFVPGYGISIDREGHGFITVPDLCQVLTTLGDKLTEGIVPQF